MKDNFIVTVNVESTENTDKTTVKLKFEFSVNPGDYGNGTYCAIYCHNENDKYFMWYNIDLRYNTRFINDERISFIATWCDNYWTGKNGAFKLVSINIE